VTLVAAVRAVLGATLAGAIIAHVLRQMTGPRWRG
jgi:hypothetical protein